MLSYDYDTNRARPVCYWSHYAPDVKLRHKSCTPGLLRLFFVTLHTWCQARAQIGHVRFVMHTLGLTPHMMSSYDTNWAPPVSYACSWSRNALDVKLVLQRQLGTSGLLCMFLVTQGTWAVTTFRTW